MPVRTAMASGKVVVTPQCVGDDLVPWRIDTLDDLAAGAFGIPEIASQLQDESGRKIDPTAIDWSSCPAWHSIAVAIGSAWARFLRSLHSTVARDATLVGLAFDCQIVDEVPTAAHDVPMHIVITPTEIVRR